MTITEFFAGLDNHYNRRMMADICRVAQLISEHQGRQFRDSGEPYLEHCFDVMNNLMAIAMPDDVILAGGLHDLIEDTDVTAEWLRKYFNSRTVKLVEAASKKPKEHFINKQARLEEYHQHLKAFAKQDFAILFIKGYDRLHNLTTLHGLVKDPDKQRRVARETLEFYVPYFRDEETIVLIPEVYREQFHILTHKLENLAKAYIID